MFDLNEYKKVEGGYSSNKMRHMSQMQQIRNIVVFEIFISGNMNLASANAEWG